MSDDDADTAGAPTRRDTIKYGSAVITGGVLAGCAGGGDDDTPMATEGGDSTPTQSPTPSPTATPEDEGTATATETPDATSTPEPTYTADLSPVGRVTLEEPPTNVFTHFPWFPDMATALGQGDTINNLWWGGTVEALEYFTAGFDDFEIEWADKAGEYGFTKEQLFELDSDIHLVDPAWVTTQDNWDRQDIDEITNEVGPWLGNYYSSFHASPPDDWAEDYRYHTLWDVFEQVSSLYGEQSRYDALAAVHEDLLTTIEEGLPPTSERPTVAYMAIQTDLSGMWVIRLNAPGYFSAHTRPLGAEDDFGTEEWDGAFIEVDMEALLEVDPDVLLTVWGITGTVDHEQMTANLADDPVGSQLAAVQNDRVHVQGTRWQGPLMNLFQLEMTAKQLYPEQFGEWPNYTNGDTYPDFDADEQLFDHQRVADIINGEI